MEFRELLRLPKEKQAELAGELLGLLTQERQAKVQRVLDKRTRHLALVFEDIYQGHNAAAGMRTADCFGVQDIYTIEKRNQFIKEGHSVAMGANHWLSFHGHKDTGECLRELKGKGYAIAATTLRPDSIDISDLPIEKPVALMIGTEKHGLSEEAHAMADYCVHLPMHGFTQSFNLSVCAALCLYDLTTRLHASKADWQLSEGERRELTLEWLCKASKHAEQICRKYLA